MRSFRERLETGTIVGDGGWGTMLAERGLPPGAPPELWTLERPDAIAQIARAYLDAGAELITTNTFGGSPMRLAQHHLEDHLEEVNRKGVEIVRNAVGGRALVSASMGPTGRLLAPLGDADPAAVLAGFERQAAALAEAGTDLVCIETMTDLEEAVLAVRAVRSVAPDLPVVATMTFEWTPRGAFTVMGTSVAAACEGLAAAGADVVGANCGGGMDETTRVAEECLRSTALPVAIQPNAGLPRLERGRLRWPAEPEAFAAALVALASKGVRVIGGCCGTTPEHIRALRSRVGRGG